MKKEWIKYLVVAAVVVAGYNWLICQLVIWRGQSYVMGAVESMAEKWDYTELDSRAHTVLTDGLYKSNQSTSDYFKVLRSLGAKQSGECQMLAMARVVRPESFTSVSYSCKMFFENSPATINLEIRQDSLFSEWKIASLNVDSPLFSQQQKQ